MINRFLILGFLAVFLAFSCEDEEFGPVLSIGNAPALTSPAPGSSFVLTEAKANDLFADFTWSAAEFGFPAGAQYSLELDLAGKNFAEPVTLGTVNGRSLSLTQGRINGVLISKGLPGNVAADVEFRVVSNVNPDVEPVISPTLTLKITPYEAVVVYPKLQVPGSYQGWNPGDENTVIYSVKSDGRFEGYIYFPDANAEYKFTDGPSWDKNWGDTGADGTLDAGGDNIKTAEAGVYRLSVNINALTHSSLKTSWGLIGSATPGGWDSDQDMTFDPATGVWSVTLNLTAGEIKFRANDDWAVNFGDDNANRSLEYGGANIAIAEGGRYLVELILNQAVYSYKVTKL